MAPTIVTARPSRIHTVPRPMMTIQCHLDHGRRSIRAGMFVSIVRRVAPSLVISLTSHGARDAAPGLPTGETRERPGWSASRPPGGGVPGAPQLCLAVNRTEGEPPVIYAVIGGGASPLADKGTIRRVSRGSAGARRAAGPVDDRNRVLQCPRGTDAPRRDRPSWPLGTRA